MRQIEVVAAIIFQNDKVMSVQRAEHEKEYVSLKWEFPGGKVEVGESREEALLQRFVRNCLWKLKFQNSLDLSTPIRIFI